MPIPKNDDTDGGVGNTRNSGSKSGYYILAGVLAVIIVVVLVMTE